MVVLPLGVGRSGTSIIAGLLHNLGVYMGRDFIPIDSYNIHGYFEDKEIMLLQSKLLHSINRSWWNPPLSDLELKNCDQTIISELRSIIADRSNCEGVWGWKDPRTKFLLPLYSDLLDNVHYIIVFRDVLATAMSIMKRDKIDEIAAYYVIQSHTNKLYDIIFKRQSPTLIMSFQDFFNRPEFEIDRICDFIGIGKQGDRLRTFIDPNEKHF